MIGVLLAHGEGLIGILSAGMTAGSILAIAGIIGVIHYGLRLVRVRAFSVSVVADLVVGAVVGGLTSGIIGEATVGNGWVLPLVKSEDSLALFYLELLGPGVLAAAGVLWWRNRQRRKTTPREETIESVKRF